MSIILNEEVNVTLLDGQTLSLRPLKLSLLREFMKHFDKIQDAVEDNDKSLDALLACVHVALKQYKPELLTDLAALEEILDLPTVNKIVEVASGLNNVDVDLLNSLQN